MQCILNDEIKNKLMEDTSDMYRIQSKIIADNNKSFHFWNVKKNPSEKYEPKILYTKEKRNLNAKNIKLHLNLASPERMH